MQSQHLPHFWFTELTPKQHYARDAVLDKTISIRFGATLEVVLRCDLFDWRNMPEVPLSEVVVLNQLTRNVWLDTPALLHRAH